MKKFSNIIYFDNAATTRKKPETVYQAFNNFVREIGASPGRGSHFLAIEASRALYESRKVISNYFGCPNISNTIFTKNATEAANLFLRGFLKKGDHVILSPFEHNAILRPIHKLKEEGIIDYDIIPVSKSLDIAKEAIEELIQPNTVLCIMTFASNVTGKKIFTHEINKFLHSNNITVLLDTAQGAGRASINMLKEGIDFLIFTGHKDLYGLPGSGGLCFLDEINIVPLIQGGTGVHAETFTNPRIFPEGLEAGTLNMPSIWSLKSGIEFVQDNKEKIANKEKMLFEKLVNGLNDVPRVISYTNNSIDGNLAIVSFNIEGMDCQKASFLMSEEGICVRSGIHCSILAHKSLKTEDIGTIRASLDYYNSIEEVDRFIEVIRKITKE